MADVDLTRVRAADVLRDTDRVSVGVVRVLASGAGSPAEEREYEVGDEALVEAGLAEWVVAPVHSPEAGRRLDHDAEREQTPRGGVEAYPPAEPTTGARRSEAREQGYVAAHIDDGLGEKLHAKRREVVRDTSSDESDDTKAQAGLAGLGVRSGPVTARSDLAADKQLADAAKGDAGEAKARAPQGERK
jgi:hypothetical protein